MQDYSTADKRFRSESVEAQDSITSVSFTTLNRSNRNLTLTEDRDASIGVLDPVVILVAGYGKMKSSHIRLAYYLAHNGFRVIRYDHSNHIGESDGPILLTTLSQMAADLESVIDYVEANFRGAKIGVVAESLGARVALKVASTDRRVGFFASVIGVFDIQATLRTIYNEDGFAEKLRGIKLGIRDIMGFQVDSDRFILDAVNNRYQSLNSAERDAEVLTSPTYFFVAENDPWVRADEVQRLFDHVGAAQKKMFLLPNVMHELYENPHVAADTCCEIVRAAQRSFVSAIASPTLVRVPPERTIAARIRLEKRARMADLNSAEEKLFWSEYLEKYAYIVKLQDYWNLLDAIAGLLGSWKKGESVLDAGSGGGHFGAFLMVRKLYQALQLRTASLHRKSWIHYLGIDFVHDALRQAKVVHRQISDEFDPQIEWMRRDASLVEFSYLTLDLNQHLPLRSQTFDKVISNLVLSYVRDPAFTVAELCRVLKAGGRIVITSLKPNADLSQIYRNFVSTSRTADEVEQARMVLSNAGLIRYKEAEGFYQFFAESQLVELLERNGCTNVSTLRAFGDQANVVVAEKSAF